MSNPSDKPKPLHATARVGYPFLNKEGKEITDPQAFHEGMVSVKSGHYPMGVHGFFHGGIHFDRSCATAFSMDEGIRCIADGEVVAYRLNRRYFDATPGAPADAPVLRPYSTGFVLVRHRLQAPTCPPPPRPAPMENPGADLSNWGTYLYADERGQQTIGWLRHNTRLEVEVGRSVPGQSLVRVLNTDDTSQPRQGWVRRVWLDLGPADDGGLVGFLGMKQRLFTRIVRGERPDPKAMAAYEQNQAAQREPPPSEAPSLTLYSLYMHVADYESYLRQPTWKPPTWWGTKRYRVGAKAKDRASTGQREKSGAQWHERFLPSSDLADLKSPFRENVFAFVAALRVANVTVKVETTIRPAQRSYLMYYASQIRNGMNPSDVPAFEPQNGDEPVNIDWEHLDVHGVPNKSKAVAAARAMYDAYGAKGAIAKPYRSNHYGGDAIDMTLSPSWAIGRTVKDAHGNAVSIKNERDIIGVGATYGVLHWNHAGPKAKEDPVHWSLTGN